MFFVDGQVSVLRTDCTCGHLVEQLREPGCLALCVTGRCRKCLGQLELRRRWHVVVVVPIRPLLQVGQLLLDLTQLGENQMVVRNHGLQKVQGEFLGMPL